MNLGAGLRLALGLLTIIPVRPPEKIGREQARVAMLVAPLAVLPVTVVAAGLGWGGLALGLPPALAGVLVVGALAVGTRAMHLDGLADTVDGLGSGKDASGALEIMRRGDVGPMGAVALIVVLIAQVVASGVLLERPWGWLLLALLLAAARGALVMGCLANVPAARPDGLGALVAGSVDRTTSSLHSVLLVAAVLATSVFAGQPLWQGMLALAVMVMATVWLYVRAVVRLGGITGDVLGAAVEVAATALLVVSAISV
ncbi:MAG TPA: adenosylcobinamide-GDP ribazoletransferase [Propionicimonas sp.]|nr:adenosylcobinamide-GDP ribazoletransferase [Propionicimonas sp.]HRA05724.1 adenosylcobinamide-GDP ribazoletransferase [Propionicimonas sp.]